MCNRTSIPFVVGLLLVGTAFAITPLFVTDGYRRRARAPHSDSVLNDVNSTPEGPSDEGTARKTRVQGEDHAVL
jgi:hypothetical protein